MSKVQRSKRARKHRKAAEAAGVHRNTGHPSHIKRHNDHAVRGQLEWKYRKEEKHERV
jgi:hypothetical protein